MLIACHKCSLPEKTRSRWRLENQRLTSMAIPTNRCSITFSRKLTAELNSHQPMTKKLRPNRRVPLLLYPLLQWGRRTWYQKLPTTTWRRVAKCASLSHQGWKRLPRLINSNKVGTRTIRTKSTSTVTTKKTNTKCVPKWRCQPTSQRKRATSNCRWLRTTKKRSSRNRPRSARCPMRRPKGFISLSNSWKLNWISLTKLGVMHSNKLSKRLAQLVSNNLCSNSIKCSKRARSLRQRTLLSVKHPDLSLSGKSVPTIPKGRLRWNCLTICCIDLQPTNKIKTEAVAAVTESARTHSLWRPSQSSHRIRAKLPFSARDRWPLTSIRRMLPSNKSTSLSQREPRLTLLSCKLFDPSTLKRAVLPVKTSKEAITWGFWSSKWLIKLQTKPTANSHFCKSWRTAVTTAESSSSFRPSQRAAHRPQICINCSSLRNRKETLSNLKLLLVCCDKNWCKWWKAKLNRAIQANWIKTVVATLRKQWMEPAKTTRAQVSWTSSNW